MKVILKKSDRELFEGSYVRYVWIKDDLQQEELDLYINLCTDIVNLTNMQVELNDLIAMRTQCAEDSEGKRLSLSIVNSIKDVRAEMNESKKRAKNAVEALQGKRNERIDVKAKENASLIQLIDFWRVQESREIMVKLAKVRQQKIKNEIKRIENLDDLKAQVWGNFTQKKLFDMAWVIGQQKVEREKDFNEEILKIEGELNEIQAKLTLIKFLWHNLGFTVYLLTGVRIIRNSRNYN